MVVELIYNVAIILFLLIPIAFIAGMVKPNLFNNILGKHANRKKIAQISLIAFIAMFIVIGVSEPESVKQARLAEEKAQLEEQERLEEERNRLAEEAPRSEPAPEPHNPEKYWHKVERVVDGDTVKASVDGKVESIRIIGINSPEATTRTECFGSTASKKAKEFLEGKWILLEKDDSQSDRDKYGRLLRYVWFDTGTDFGRRMIEEGYAYEYTYDIPYAKQAEYKDTQEYADERSHGLWSSDTCDGKRTKPAPKVTAPKPKPVAPAPAPKPAPRSNCDPNYTPCVPNVSYDLDCPDIGFSVRVIGSDPHGFDGNGDGYGCESY